MPEGRLSTAGSNSDPDADSDTDIEASPRWTAGLLIAHGLRDSRALQTRTSDGSGFRLDVLMRAYKARLGAVLPKGSEAALEANVGIGIDVDLISCPSATVQPQDRIPIPMPIPTPRMLRAGKKNRALAWRAEPGGVAQPKAVCCRLEQIREIRIASAADRFS
jgi:hypothetical protein